MNIHNCKSTLYIGSCPPTVPFSLPAAGAVVLKLALVRVHLRNAGQLSVPGLQISRHVGEKAGGAVCIVQAFQHSN